MRRVEKPWGHELVFAEAEAYAGKVLVITAGHSLPRQYFDRWDFTLAVESGVVQLELGLPPRVDIIELRAGKSFRIKPGTVHRLRAIKAARVYVVSTPEVEEAVPVDAA